MWKEFKEFLIKQNAIALAIAVVIGAALNTVVQAIVNDIILPVVQTVSPSVAWQEWTWHNFKFGDLASAVLNFFIVGFVAWRISKIFIKPAPAGPPTTKSCDFCKSTIDIAATRCPHCTSQLAA
ncbi:MAG: MscL family protein [Gemmatimonadota bacterium]|nr:MscL family protein [Gemmatimonadota bacterium]